jgi:hypothetical protein
MPVVLINVLGLQPRFRIREPCVTCRRRAGARTEGGGARVRESEHRREREWECTYGGRTSTGEGAVAPGTKQELGRRTGARGEWEEEAGRTMRNGRKACCEDGASGREVATIRQLCDKIREPNTAQMTTCKIQNANPRDSCRDQNLWNRDILNHRSSSLQIVRAVKIFLRSGPFMQTYISRER